MIASIAGFIGLPGAGGGIGLDCGWLCIGDETCGERLGCGGMFAPPAAARCCTARCLAAAMFRRKSIFC